MLHLETEGEARQLAAAVTASRGYARTTSEPYRFGIRLDDVTAPGDVHTVRLEVRGLDRTKAAQP
ncbi:hypothetical protein ICW40_07470 [Actinotalea ferrariae]|uniref:hypothetical protein n=1 Tax=Actinotalea ferrariae TaxID=1386098 RepID=UPI001C8BD2BE|nr:hypothetical protein [Actinotalea ferrariae]MBX9244648.1 hypothetical protein [Actinotalea ferrariae]